MHWVKSLGEVTFELWTLNFGCVSSLCSNFTFNFNWMDENTAQILNLNVYSVQYTVFVNQVKWIMCHTCNKTLVVSGDSKLPSWWRAACLIGKNILVMTWWQYTFELHCYIYYIYFFLRKIRERNEGRGKVEGFFQPLWIPDHESLETKSLVSLYFNKL